MDFKAIAGWLGHRDGGVLAAKTYGHLRNEHSAAMAQRMKRIVSNLFMPPYRQFAVAGLAQHTTTKQRDSIAFRGSDTTPEAASECIS